MNQTTYTVAGMTCNHCAASVTEELIAVSGIEQVDVDLATAQVRVTSERPLPFEAIGRAVTEAGYELVD
ncbi:heavy-metal-associated domain-containing protein [Prauserella alba]|uniref:Heavy-metal-associated domain-containing protein n=1 Tax=Prauserella alba TaxID=176898 RepID=A0ABP4G585_9PSEU|nr:heavy-metal-associated domain-containing protein [Prauserella alba]MCP2182917.1 Copper chaperone CopZ [Prauserella alba]